MEQQALQAGCAMAESRREYRDQIGIQQLPNIPIRQFPFLPAPQFYQMHKAYLDRNGVPADRQQPTIQGVPIDLHILHTEMMKVGGLLNVGFFSFSIWLSMSHVCSVACGCVQSPVG